MHPELITEKYIREHTAAPDDNIFTRRQFLIRSGMGFGALSMAGLYGINPWEADGATGSASTSPLLPKSPHFPVKAKHIIHIFAGGAPSHVDTFDPKPELNKYDGQTIPGHDGLAFGSPFKFPKRGKSGLEISEIWNKLGEHVDEMAVIRSMWTDIPAHDVASRFMNTGSLQLPKPSLGSWVVYGLGTENQNMPGFISLGGDPEWRQSSFLPGIYQGCNVNYAQNMSLDEVLLNIKSQFSPLDRQRRQLDFVAELNKQHAAALQKDAQLEARIESFEIAFKMQTEATDAFDISKEPDSVKALYMSTAGNGMGMGMKSAAPTTQAPRLTDNGAKMLIARRLVERGVRFVQIKTGGWDTHADVANSVPRAANAVDAEIAGLLTDLKQRGMLENTLVIWGGEFGRTVTRDRNGGGAPGRDHLGRGFCAWMAGGGVKGGMAYGATDEFGGRAVENKVHPHDLHATILALMGFDHTKLTYRYNGRDFRLTDNFGNVVKDIIA
ncbi:MAG TPA: DUF1501 domain-containing protein [Chthoniobacteraceae bacterium]|jgi:hypothetical protein|nr:DUF1501 domain-containing protein [Chthoniobacteraceae bacterium]